MTGADATRVGREAEELAAGYLRERGYAILDRNRRLASGELDIVARDGDILVFVEVKARGAGSAVAPVETVGAAKRRRLVEAAGAYLAARPGPLPFCRFDVISVRLDGSRTRVSHLVDAFRPGD